MIRLITSIIAICLLHTMVSGQVYTIEMSSGTLALEQVHDVEIVGHDKSNIEITTRGDKIGNKKAEGLRILSPTGLQDNTGVNLHQEKTDAGINLTQVASNLDVHYIIAIPRGVNISYTQSGHQGEDFIVKNISGEIEVTSGFADVRLENVSGPCSVNTLHGDIEARFDQLPADGSITLRSAHGDVDVTIPSNGKADLSLRSGFGTIYTDLDLEMDGDSQHKSNSRWKFNGGGVSMHLESSHSDVFLRKN